MSIICSPLNKKDVSLLFKTSVLQLSIPSSMSIQYILVLKINYIRPQPLKKKSVFMFELVNNLHVVNTSRL